VVFTVIRRYPTLSRYITSEFLLSFLVSFLFYFLIFFLNQLLLMAQGILAKGIPVGSVLLLMIYSLPSFITLSAPFATLTAALMAYGRF
jgi:lipopolysaccharide export system permease protein